MSTQPNLSGDAGGPRSLSRLSIALLAMTTLAALVALALLWATRWAVVHIASDRATSIDDAEQAALATPLFWVGVALIATIWIAIWRWLCWRYIAIPIIAALVAASLTGFYFWRSQTVDQPISVTIWHCVPDANPFSDEDDNLLEDCVPAPESTHLTLGSFTDRDAYDSEEPARSPALFTGLPIGTYDGYMTTTAPIDTASIVLAAEMGDEIRPLHLLDLDDPFGDESRTWSTPIRLNPDVSAYLLLVYLSETPALPDARITFDVQQCANASPTTFDVAACQPTTFDEWILQDVTDETGPANFRQPILTREGSTVTYSNLEERTYRFTPLIGNRAITSSDYGFLVIPTDGPQTTEASVLALSPQSQQEEFSVEITPDSGTAAYTIYVFPTQNIFAGTPFHGHIAAAPGAIQTP